MARKRITASSPQEKLVRARLKPPKTPVYIRIDPDVLAWLKAEGPGYQVRINVLLRKAMERARVRSAKKLP